MQSGSKFAATLGRVSSVSAWVCVLVLVTSGVAKIVSSLGSAEVLAKADPIFGVANSRVYFWVGIAELGVAAAVAALRSINLRFALIAALSTDFLLYRVGLWWLGKSHPCPCFGNAASWTHLDARTVDSLTAYVLVWLIGSSYAILWAARKHTPLSPTDKFPVEAATAAT